ncbi:MAG: ABC transporter ATP-binding protein [Synechococcales cyanobacterium RM1_1_8]|nr:ABC transporter ATP-binding protein [Synechococcales cyanobacterium RM1_1_8]
MDASPAAPIVQVEGLCKTYRTGFWMNRRIQSLQGVSLSVQPGETFGLLGPNGAGKTTLLKLLLGILRPTGGRGQILGQPLGHQPSRQRLGYLPENADLHDYLTGWEFLQFSAGLCQIPGKVQRQRIPELLNLVGLDPRIARKKQMRQYSKGMRQRVAMAQALINDPDLVFLDEPMSGLDPLGRVQVRQIIERLKAQGKTIFFNSHVLGDVEQICDRVAILAQGQLRCMGSLDELLGEADHYRVLGRGGDLALLNQWLTQFEAHANQWSGSLQRDPRDFLSSLQLMGGELISLSRARPSLEEFFVDQLAPGGDNAAADSVHS